MSLAGLSLRDLEYVVAIADRMSFVRAAEHCNVSQPSLSAQVRKIEGWAGAPIFERTSRRVILTVAGGRFVDQARRVLAEASLLRLGAHSQARPFGGRLRLSAIATLGPYYFPLVLRGLRQAYPDLSLVLGEGQTNDLLTQLRQGDLDAVVIATPASEDTLVDVPLFREPFVMACPEGHEAANLEGLGWENLEPGERLLLGEGHCLRDQALAACGEVEVTSRHATSLETLKYMVAAGEGCTLIPALAVSDMPGLRYVETDSTGFGRDISLVWRRSDPRAADFETLATCLRAIDHPTITAHTVLAS
jgi:LysR family hydrogen peroxide-inducible transcriptional activator